MLLEVKEFIYSFLKDRGIDLDGVSFQPLRGDGSKRAFWRITVPLQELYYIAMENPPNDPASYRENFAYLMIGRHLHQKGVPVPEIYSYDLKYGWFLMEDMGSTSLQDLVSSTNDILPIYEELLAHMFRLQIAGAEDFDTSWCSQTQRYDRNVMRDYEANYFKDAFLRLYLGLKDEWPELDVPFNHLSENASEADGVFLIHRDFQSRNIMISKGNIGIIDWQGARLGPLGYDLASLLIDPYTNLSSQNKVSLYERYVHLIKENNVGLIESFEQYYPYLAIQRNLQILGAFAYLTKTMKKPFFENYIPTALHTLNNLLHEISDPELCPLKDLVKDIYPL